MPRTAGEMVAEARSRIQSLTPDQVEAEIAAGSALLVDVRDAAEHAGGTIAGALHASRGMLEFHADPKSPAHKPALDPARRTIVFCGTGGRSALAGATLRELGFADVAQLDGGINAWKAAGKALG